jgi:hypothetical protein
MLHSQPQTKVRETIDGEMALGAPSKTSDHTYSEQETQQRFDKLVRAALNTKPKPLKTMGPKGVAAQSKKFRAIQNKPPNQR